MKLKNQHCASTIGFQQRQSVFPSTAPNSCASFLHIMIIIFGIIFKSTSSSFVPSTLTRVVVNHCQAAVNRPIFVNSFLQLQQKQQKHQLHCIQKQQQRPSSSATNLKNMKLSQEGVCEKGDEENISSDKNVTNYLHSNTNSTNHSTTASTTDDNNEHKQQKQKKHHTITICLVPPPSGAEDTWDAVTKARTELRDPGLYRWPPHVNILYPFVSIRSPLSFSASTIKNSVDVCTDAVNNDNDDSNTESDNTSEDGKTRITKDPNNMNNNKNDNVNKSKSKILNIDVLKKIRNATKKIEPFDVSLDQLGTFGGKSRGVLWLYPTTSYRNKNDSSNNNDETNEKDKSIDSKFVNSETEEIETTLTDSCHPEPLCELHKLLIQEFPICSEDLKGREYKPHMTLSHFPSLDEAEEAKQQIQKWWFSNNDNWKKFVCNEIYLLERNGDGGQFLRIATISLGMNEKKDNKNSTDDSCDGIYIHSKIGGVEEGEAFPNMPLIEEDWVHEERMQLKQRRNNRPGQRRRGRRTTRSKTGDRDSRRTKDTPEIIAQKRAERKAKKERLLLLEKEGKKDQKEEQGME